jgi:hypothetical protein
VAQQAESEVVATELERVLPKVPILFDREGPFYSAIEKKNIEVISNRQMRGPLEIRPGGKFKFFNPDGGDLGRGSGPFFDKFVLSPQHIAYAVEYTILSQWVTDDKRKAVINNVQRNLAMAMREFRRHCDAMAVGAGDAVIGTIDTGGVSTSGGKDTYTLDDSFGAKLCRFDQDINVYSSDLLTNRTSGGEVTIDLHDLANKQIRTHASVSGAAATDKIVVSGITATPAVGIKGVLYHHDSASTGTWLGFNRADTPEIRANRVNGNSAALTLPLPRLALNKAADRVGVDNIGNYQAWMHPAQAQAYEELGFLVTQINSTGEGKGLDLYFGGAMTMAGAPVKKSFNWHHQRIDFVNLDYWGRGELHPAGFYEPSPGKRLYELRGASGGVAAAVIFYLVASFDLFVSNPASCSYIDNLAIPSGY